MNEKVFKVAVITISDSSFEGKRKDLSGPLAVKLLKEQGMEVNETLIIPDEREQITDHLMRLSDTGEFDLVVTTGGTGFAPRDVTPEATLDVIDKRADGLADLMRMESLKKTPHAALSRGVCGIRNKTLIINLPGSPKAVEENLDALKRVLEHGLKLMQGQILH